MSVSLSSTAERKDLKLAVDAQKLIAATAGHSLRNDSKIAQIYFGGEVKFSDFC